MGVLLQVKEMNDFAAQIKARVTMAEICRMYGIEVNYAGFARCPFHSENTASLRVYPGDRGWHCFGACGEGGSVIDFVMKFFGLDLMGAVRRIDADFGLGLPLDREQSEEERKEAARIAYERRQELARRKIAHEAVIDRYYNAIADWVNADSLATENAPRGVLEPVSDIYASALKARDRASYQIELAACELYKIEQREKNA